MGWLDMAKPLIAAYKAGINVVLPYIEDEKLVYWYRPSKKDVNYDATDATMLDRPEHASSNFFAGRPNV